PGAIVPAGEGEGEGGVVGEGEGEGGVVGEGEGEGGVVGEGEGEGGGEEKRSWLWWLLPLLFIIILILYLRRQKKPKPVIPPEPPEVIETIKEKKEAVIRILELIKEKRKLIPKIADIGKKKPTEGGIYVDDSNSDESAYLGDKKEEASKKIRELKKDLKELANINKREESYLKDIVDIEKKVIEKYTKKGMQGEYGGYEGGYQGYVYEGGYDAYGPEGNKKIQELIKICNEIILIINEKLKGVLDEENKNMVNESELEETEQKLAERRKNLVWITKVLTAIDNIGKLWWNKDKTAVNKTEYYWISILYGRIKKQLRLMKEIEIPVTPPPAHIPIHNKEDAIKAFTEYFKTKDGIITELNRVPPKHPYEVMFGRLAEENEKAKGYIKELERIEKEYIAKYSAPEKKPHGEYTGSKEIRNL
ncbi:hypothetical protein J4209_04360, partial [Candidatus Woesearchaeota archaeon]|nr:hypothetical protein [Candidatus Woesearchaeota archaeon]